jgi:hypothetical protein
MVQIKRQRQIVDRPVKAIEDATLKLLAHTDAGCPSGNLQHIALPNTIDFAKRHRNYFAFAEADYFYRYAAALSLEPTDTSHCRVRTMRLDAVADNLLDEAEFDNGIYLRKTPVEAFKIKHDSISDSELVQLFIQ